MNEELRIKEEQWEVCVLLAASILHGASFSNSLLLSALSKQPESLEPPVNETPNSPESDLPAEKPEAKPANSDPFSILGFPESMTATESAMPEKEEAKPKAAPPPSMSFDDAFMGLINTAGMSQAVATEQTAQPVSGTPQMQPMQPMAPMNGTPQMQSMAPVNSMKGTPPVKRTPQMQSMAPMQPMQPMQPMAPMNGTPKVQPMAPMNGTPQMQSMAPMQPMQPMQPMAPMNGTPQMQSMAPMQPMQPMAPMDGTPQMQPMAPMQPVQSMDSMAPMEQQQPQPQPQPQQAMDGATQMQPMAPIQPMQPTLPLQSPPQLLSQPSQPLQSPPLSPPLSQPQPLSQPLSSPSLLGSPSSHPLSSPSATDCFPVSPFSPAGIAKASIVWQRVAARVFASPGSASLPLKSAIRVLRSLQAPLPSLKSAVASLLDEQPDLSLLSRPLQIRLLVLLADPRTPPRKPRFHFFSSPTQSISATSLPSPRNSPSAPARKPPWSASAGKSRK